MVIRSKILLLFSCVLSLTSAYVNINIPKASGFAVNRLSSSISAATADSLELPAGIQKKIVKDGNSNGFPIRIGDVVTVRYSCSADGSSSPFARSSGQKFVVGDGLMVDGWEMALMNMNEGERSVFQISDPKFGYGSAGVPPLIAENAKIEMDLEILTVEQGVDLGTIASADPLKPRTPTSIAAAYATRRELSALEAADQKEGLEGLIAKFKSFYFFGFFEALDEDNKGSSRDRKPVSWLLRPSITFPIAFATVGLAFYVLYVGGGISERGAQITDELDEFIVSSTLTNPSIIVASAADATKNIFGM